jgi:nucleoporin NUP159
MLLQLHLLAQQATENRLEFSKSAGGSRKKADLGDSTKWNLGDVVQFKQVLQQYEQDLSALKEARDTQSQALRELQSNMLKGMCRTAAAPNQTLICLIAGTRKEEIIRFNKAKNDSDFAKMLKSRTLGPEHLETQTQLRRDIRVCPIVNDVCVLLTTAGVRLCVTVSRSSKTTSKPLKRS